MKKKGGDEMDKGKRDKVKVGVKTINQLLERRKEMKMKWFWLLTAVLFATVVILGTSNNLYGEEKYTSEQLESDCELIGGSYEGGDTWGECKLTDGDSYFVDDISGWFDTDCKTQECKDTFYIVIGGSRNPAITPPSMQGDFRQIIPTAPPAPPAIQPATPGGATTHPTQTQPATPQGPTPGRPAGSEPGKPSAPSQPRAVQPGAP
ncbi:MAG: hypothetical protein AABY44_09425 [Nitrospirota bacterium]